MFENKPKQMKKRKSNLDDNHLQRYRANLIVNIFRRLVQFHLSSFFSARMVNKSVPDKMKLKLKDGAAVDPESGSSFSFDSKRQRFIFESSFTELEDTCHVLKDTDNGGIFTAVLGLVDITRGTNSYYKMQLLESDNGRQWFVFRA